MFTVRWAILFTVFLVLMACYFCGWVHGSYQAHMRMSGYMMGRMLSFDNLFVFHLIFQVYGCPKKLKHRPLYIGIIGTVFFRLDFIFDGKYFMHAFYFMYFVFGSFLSYTEVKNLTEEEESGAMREHTIKIILSFLVYSLICSTVVFYFFIRHL